MPRLLMLAFAAAVQLHALELPPPRTDVPDAILDRTQSQLIKTSQESFQAQYPVTTIQVEPNQIIVKDELRALLRKGEWKPTGEEILLDAKLTPWRDLFNGKDLEGWKTLGTAIWKVEDGVIVGGQFGDPKRNGLLRTAENFENFELQLEFMIDEHGKYNSGVYLRNDPDKTARTGYQVNIGRGAAGEFCGGVYTTDWLAKGDEQDKIRKPKEWNKLNILANGAHLVVHLNETKIVDFTDPKPDPKFLQKGVIGFQTYGAENHDGWIRFKNIRLREIKQ